jgi:hypothetical protein
VADHRNLKPRSLIYLNLKNNTIRLLGLRFRNSDFLNLEV